ncbi:hypothetical protein Cni_G26715 [Canna indica]|uniref:Uncharacterized protein n=1 Tax=Canna indica TaxID=4628 RepID=A0AAQ3KZL6_9LILI|nr:hypothetical protein Cni_G26715 [Canna indica]
MNENVLELLLPWRCSCYVHLGVELALDFFKVQNPACVHDLETYIGLLKCPGKMVQVHKEGVLGLLEKARMILLKKKMMMMKKRRFQGWTWPHAALRHVGNWVQSLRLI